MLTSFISEVPGLKVSAKKKKQTSKHVDRSSTQPPAYERIKEQLERRKKREQQAQQLQPADHSGKTKQNVGGREQREPVARQSGGGNKEEQGSGRRRSQVDEEGASERPERQTRKARSQLSQAHSGSQVAGSAQRTEVSSQRQKHQERLEKLASQKKDNPSQPEESVTESESDEEVSIQLPSGKSLPPQESSTESESETDVPHKTHPLSLESVAEPESEDVPIQSQLSLGTRKKRVSQRFTSMSPLMYSLARFKFSASRQQWWLQETKTPHKTQARPICCQYF
jgi:hypothetical protein